MSNQSSTITDVLRNARPVLIPPYTGLNDSNYEPTIRDILIKYYIEHFDKEEAEKIADLYIHQMAKIVDDKLIILGEHTK